MASAIYWQRGESLDYINSGSATIAAGTVIVLGDRIGVAGTDIPAGACGSINVEGVYIFPKASGAIGAGDEVAWDATNGVMGALGDGDVANGYAVEAAGADATTVKVKVNA